MVVIRKALKIFGKFFFFFNYIGVKDFNAAEAVVIRKTLKFFSSSFQGRLIVKSDFSNTIVGCCRKLFSLRYLKLSS